jgi:hypothetical protein
VPLGRLLARTDIGLTRNYLAGSIASVPWTQIDELTSPSVETLAGLASQIDRGTESDGETRFVLTRTVVLHQVPHLPALPGDH